MKPNEKDYVSHVAYSRAIEEYCDGLRTEIEGWKRDQKQNMRLAVELHGQLASLRKAAQMALEALTATYSISMYASVQALSSAKNEKEFGAIEALRKELG